MFSPFGAVFNGLNLNSEFDPDISSNKDSVPQVPIALFAGPSHFVTADVRQPWTNYVNNVNKYLIIGAVVSSEYSNI